MSDPAPNPVVSMCCVTFNHANTIGQCLDGMLMQKVDVPVEIVVHDDASTDGTAEIVADYAARHPGLIRAILQRENQFSRGRRPAALAFSEARGEYMALCEGDDFWTDPDKIAIQLSALEASPEVDMCAHAVTIWDYCDNPAKPAIRSSYSHRSGLHPPAAVVEKSGIAIPTASIMIRRSAVERFIAHVETRDWLSIGDVYLKFFGAARGGVHFIARSMAVYRVNAGASWSANIKQQPKFRMQSVSAKLRGFSELGKMVTHTDLKDAFARANARILSQVLADRRIPISQRLRFLIAHRRYVPLRMTHRVLSAAFRP